MPRIFGTRLKNIENLKLQLPKTDPERELDKEQDVDELVNPHIGSDRHIPSRAHSLPSDIRLQELISARFEGSFDGEPSEYKQQLCLALSGRTFSQLQGSSVRDVYRGFSAPKRPIRIPYQIVSGLCRDLPNIGDDYYANVLCRTKDLVFVALTDQVYSFNPSTKNSVCLTGEIDENVDPVINKVNALGCNANWLLSSAHNNLHIFDANIGKLATTIRETGDFNTIISDENRGFYLSSKVGGFIAHYDIRSPRVASVGLHPGIISITFNGLDKTTLAASLLVDSAVKLYDVRRPTRATFDLIDKASLPHKTCSKVLAFSPFAADILFTAGGSNDNSLNLWNSTSGTLQAEGVNGAQITNAHWLDEETMFVTEGYLSNRVSTWAIKKDVIEKESQCKGDRTSHQQRVLVSAQNPTDRSDLVTGSADECLRFWSVRKPVGRSDDSDNDEHQSKRPRSGLNSHTIR